MIFLLLIVFIQSTKAFTQSCQEMIGECMLESNCVNNICIQCDDPNLDISNLCQCQKGQYIDQQECKLCNEQCETCFGPGVNECLSCSFQEGLQYNYLENTCECSENYLPTNDPENPCQKCYSYKGECITECPEETFTNTKFMICESYNVKEIYNQDDKTYVVLAIILGSIVVVLAILLYIFFYGVFKQMFSDKKVQVYQLTIEEQEYFNKILDKEDIETKILQQEADKTRESMEKFKEEEKQQREKQAESKKQEFDELQSKVKRGQDQRKMQIIEAENVKKEKSQELEDFIQQAQLKQAEEDRAIQKEEQDRLEREKQEAQEKEEKERKAKEELLKLQKKERRNKRNQTKIEIGQKNQQKLERFRSQRMELQKQKTKLEIVSQNYMKQEEDLKEELLELMQNQDNKNLRREQLLKQKENILKLLNEATIEKQKITDEFGGYNLTLIKQKIEDLSEEDIIFLQNLRKPPQRIKMCLEALVIIVGGNSKKTSWEEIKKFISNINFRRNVIYFNQQLLPENVYKKISKDYINSEEWVLSKIYKASKAAGTFSEWIEGLIKQTELQKTNQPLFDRLIAVQNKENELQKQLFIINDEIEEYDLNLNKKQKSGANLDKIISEKQEKVSEAYHIIEENKNKIKNIDEEINQLDSANISLEKLPEDTDSENDQKSKNKENKEKILIKDM